MQVNLAHVVTQHLDDDFLMYMWKANPAAMQLEYWNKHFELQYFKEWLPPSTQPNVVFDYGCGFGGLDMQLWLAGYSVFGFDPSPGCIAVAKHVAHAHGIDINFYTEIPERWYSHVWMCHVLEHIPTNEFSKTFRRLAPVPTLITVPYARGYDDPTHVNHWFSIGELCAVLEPYVVIASSHHDEAHSVLRVSCTPKGRHND